MDDDNLITDVVVGEETEQEGTEAQDAARWEDFIDIYFSPRQLFQRRADDQIAVPLIVLLVFGVIVYLILLPVHEMIMEITLAESPEMQEAMEEMGALASVLQWVGAVTVPITYLIRTLGAALVLWAVGMLFGVEANFSRFFLIAIFAAFVYPIAELAGGFLMYLHGESGLDIVRHRSVGPLRFVGSTETPQAQMVLLQRVELFAIWQAVLWGVGIAVVGRIDRARAAAVAGVTWVLFAVPGLLGALVATRMGG